MPDIVLKHNDEELTVDLESVTLPEGYKVLSADELSTAYLDRATVNENYVPKAEMTRRFKNWVPKADATDDEAIIASVLEKHGKKVPDIDQAKEQWVKAELAPAREKYTGVTSRLVKSEIRANATEFFDKPYVTPAPNGGASWAENAFSGEFEYNDEYGYVVAMLNGSPVTANNPTTTHPYRDVREHFQVTAAQSAYEQFRVQPPKGGGGSGNNNNTKAQSVMTRSQMSESDKIDYVKQHGSKALLALPE